jgi:hypothetical protein
MIGGTSGPKLRVLIGSKKTIRVIIIKVSIMMIITLNE